MGERKFAGGKIRNTFQFYQKLIGSWIPLLKKWIPRNPRIQADEAPGLFSGRM